MFLVRAFGWFMIALAVTLASADAVMALGPRDYAGLATGDLWSFLLGQTPVAGADPQQQENVGITLLHLPVWLIFGPLGAILCILARRRPRNRRRYRR